MYKSKEPLGKFVVTSSDSAITFEFLKKTFDKMTFLVLLFVKRNKNSAIASGFNTSSRSLSEDLFSELVRR